jgi:FkbM family methyltransferase
MNLVHVFNGKYNVATIENDQYIGHTIRCGYEWDGWMRHDIVEHYKENTDIIDAGANIGYNTLMFSDYGPVHSFEPVYHKIIEYNIKINKLNNPVRVYDIALSNKVGETLLYIPKNATDNPTLINYGGTSMNPHDGHNMEKPLLCRCDMLDNVYSGVPSIIKMDIEGEELNMLRGAVETIKKHKPVLIIEIHNFSENHEVVQLLKTIGYTNVPISRPEHMYIFTS